MFTPLSRIVLLLCCAVLSTIAAISGIYSLLIIACIVSFILLYGYYRKGSVGLALRYMKEENYKEAERVLAYTTHPERLDKQQKNHYLFIKGFIARDKDQYEEAVTLLEEALSGGLKNQQNRAMALLALADIQMMQSNKNAARNYLMQMKGLKVPPHMMSAIRKMQEWTGL